MKAFQPSWLVNGERCGIEVCPWLLPWIAAAVALLSSADATGALPADAAITSADTWETPSAFVTLRPLDEAVQRRLKELGIPVAAPCSDAVFIRRIYIDLLGTLPTPEEVRDFLAEKRDGKRERLVDRVLGRAEFADYWALKWSDRLRIKAEFPINLWPNAAQAYHRWVRTAVAENRPYDRFATELLTASGSNFREGPANFYRAMQNRDPQGIASAVATTFLGVRLERWPSDRVARLSAFFERVGFKATGEWKEEIVFDDRGRAGDAEREYHFPDGTAIRLPAGQDPRAAFADWLVRPGNPWFSRAMVNATWAWMFGRGIVEEADDIRADNPPSNPELLHVLETEFVRSGYDFKALLRSIVTSRTYQSSSLRHTSHPQAEACFAFYPTRRLEAEVLIDAINQVTGASESYLSAIPEPWTFIPADCRSISLPDGSISSSFLESFGRPSRDTGKLSERNDTITGAQALHLLNSSHIQRKLTQGSRMPSLWKQGRPWKDTLETLYLSMLSRAPTAAEMAVADAHLSGLRGDRRAAVIDLAWALLNTAEFLSRH